MKRVYLELPWVKPSHFLKSKLPRQELWLTIVYRFYFTVKEKESQQPCLFFFILMFFSPVTIEAPSQFGQKPNKTNKRYTKDSLQPSTPKPKFGGMHFKARKHLPWPTWALLIGKGEKWCINKLSRIFNPMRCPLYDN